MFITVSDYVGPHANSIDWNDERRANAEDLLPRVDALVAEAVADGVKVKTNPSTGTNVSGLTFGGFRPKNCAVGAPGSSHKEAKAVDVYDHERELARWCFAHLDRLEAHGLYMEHPDDTPTWCHLTTRRPGSGNRVFHP